MSERELSGGIFISYRRDEASGYAGRLSDHLANSFGENQIFMDVDSIEPGMDYREIIDRAVGACEVLLVVMGPRWLTATDRRGQRRLDDTDDLVRLEIEAALTRRVRVIPVLIDGTPMPAGHELPDSIASLARRNAFSLHHESFRADMTRLERFLRSLVTATAPISGKAEHVEAPAGDPERTPDSRTPKTPRVHEESPGSQPLDAVQSLNDEQATLNPASTEPNLSAGTQPDVRVDNPQASKDGKRAGVPPYDPTPKGSRSNSDTEKLSNLSSSSTPFNNVAKPAATGLRIYPPAELLSQRADHPTTRPDRYSRLNGGNPSPPGAPKNPPQVPIWPPQPAQQPPRPVSPSEEPRHRTAEQPTKHWPWLWIVLTTVSFVGLSALIAISPWRPSSTPPLIPRSLALPADTLLVAREFDGSSGLYSVVSGTGHVGTRLPTSGVEAALLSPDRQSVVYVQTHLNDTLNSIRVAAVDGTGDRDLFVDRVPGCDRYLRAAWNPVKQDQLTIGCVASDGSGSMRTLDLNGKVVHEFDVHGAVVDSMSYSPDGSEIAYFEYEGGTNTIYSVKSDGSSSTPIELSDMHKDTNPVWSPDGTSIVFQREVSPDRHVIMVMASDGSQPRELGEDSGDAQDPAWSADGQSVVFRSNRDQENSDVYHFMIMDSDGSKSRSLIPNDVAIAVSTPAWVRR